MKSLIDVTDLSVSETKELMDTAKDIIENPSKYSEACKGKKLATLFFEPSTRTRLSFEAAMLMLLVMMAVLAASIVVVRTMVNKNYEQISRNLRNSILRVQNMRNTKV